jgi:peptide/nickel transport system substrate-binding protein
LIDAVYEWQTTAPGSAEYLELGREILTINAEDLWIIGTVGQAPKPVIFKTDLKNTPEEGLFGWDYRFFFPYMAEQWYFE